MKKDDPPKLRRLVWSVILATSAMWLGACAAPPAGHDPVLVERLDAILTRLADSGATVSARVVVLPSRRELYARNIDVPCIPASNMKLPVSAAGLDLFGPEHTFCTYLACDGEDLWIVGTGDPAIGDGKIARRNNGSTIDVLEAWSQALLDRGVTHVSGDLIYYDGALDDEQVHRTWEVDDLVHWYAAPVSGLNFNDNCVDITVFPTAEGEPAGFKVVPRAGGIAVVNECVSGAEEEPSISRDADANVYRLSGGCTERAALKSKPVTHPGAFFADALRTHMREKGIVIEGEIRRAHEPLDGRIPPRAEYVVAVHESRIVDVLWRINKSSQNLFAECLCKLTGQEYLARRGCSAPGSWAAGEEAIRSFLRRYDIDDQQFVLADGSGLSRANRVTVRLISDVLMAMFEHAYARQFRASLGVGGRDGTIRKRFAGMPDRVFAKTGYIRGVRALSGYIRTRTDGWLCFSIIYNDIPGSVKPYEALQDEVCGVLFDWPDVRAAVERPAEDSATHQLLR